MSVTITDELRLLIKAEAKQAIRETQEYRKGLLGAHAAHGTLAVSAKRLTKELLTSVGAFASVGAAMAALVRYGKEASDVYTETQGDIRKFEITYRDVLKGAESVTLAWAETFGYAESTAKKVMGSAGDIYTGMGIAAAGALDLADQTAYLGGALSKLNPQLGSASEATQALISGATGEREALKRWGVIIQETAVQQKLLERGQKDLTGSALLAAKAQAVLDIAYEQSPNALNAVAGSAELVADTNRYLSETWKEHLELTGQVIGEGLQPLKKAIAELLKERNELTKAEREANEVGINTDLIQGYTDTADQVERLANEYDSLIHQASLNADEQDRLREVIQDIGELVPTAASGWDLYGKAIGISADKAREFAKQQRELRELEIEIQTASLERQQYLLNVTREEDLATKERIEKRLAPLREEQMLLEEAYKAAMLYVETVSGASLADQDNALAEGAKILEENAEAFRKAGYDLTNDLVPGRTISVLIDQYDEVTGKITKFDEKQSDAIANLKEYDIVTAQIKLLRTELDYLSGDADALIGSLVDQVYALETIPSVFYQLQEDFALNFITVDEYRAALESLIETANTPIAPDTSSATAWTEFVKKLTGDMGLDSAIAYEVELSPIIDDTGTTQLESQMDYYKDLIQDLWGGKDRFDSLEEWQAALDQLVPKYEEVKSQIDDITKAEKQKASAAELEFSLLSNQEQVVSKLAEYEATILPLIEAGLLTEEQKAALIEQQRDLLKDKYGITKEEEDLQEQQLEAQKLLRTLLSKEQQDQISLIEYKAQLLTYQEAGLMSESQVNELLEKRKELLAGNTEEVQTWNDYLKDSFADLKEDYFSLDAMGKLLSDTFADIGAAMGSGEDAFQGSTKALQEFTSQLLKELSLIATTAGLRAIAEGGLAAVPLAIGLFALGGVAGIGSGFFGSSGSGVDSSIMDSLGDELKVRESLNEALEETLDLEMDMLRRQLDRNLISEEEYMAGVQEIWDQRNQGEAQADALDLISDAMDEIDTALSDMSGWTKFWTQKDETLESEAAALQALAEQINNTTDPETLRALLQELKDYGIDIDSLPAFASGGSFITNGPQPILVGDNPSGREKVQITPLGSSQEPSWGSQPMVVNIYGDVLDYEDLYRKLDKAGAKVQRKMKKRVSA